MKSSMVIVKRDVKTTTVVIGGKPYEVMNSNPQLGFILETAQQYNDSRDITQRETLAAALLDAVQTPYRRVIEGDERFEQDKNGKLYLKGVSQPIPKELAKMIKSYIDNKIDLTPLTNFWLLLSRNPDPDVQSQLFGFLQHNGHPITTHGYFVAYKAVDFTGKYDTKTGQEIREYDPNTGQVVEKTPDSSMVFQPFHKGPHGMVIKVGTPVTMPREECDSDPNRTCSKGLHVGSMAYVGDFGHNDRVVLECLINPRNVVAVPTDYNNTKMRVCEYYPLSVATGENPDIYLANDYKDYEKSKVEAELESFRQARQDTINRIVAEVEEHEAILKGLY